MPILTEKYPRPWPMRADEMRERLGLGKKLPPLDHSLTHIVQGYRVTVLTQDEARRRAGHANKPHRIMATCKLCCEMIPFGRLAQHEPACKRRHA